jgi:hypothetical protein
MTRLMKFQLIGPAALFLTVLAAEIAVCALAYMPTSETLWYINLKLFGIFQRSHYVLSDVTTIPGSQLFFIALPIFVTASSGFIRKQALLLAIASNFTFVYASFLLISWNLIEKSASLQASSSALISIPSGAGLYTLTILLGTSSLSFLISHLLYLNVVRARA